MVQVRYLSGHCTFHAAITRPKSNSGQKFTNGHQRIILICCTSVSPVWLRHYAWSTKYTCKGWVKSNILCLILCNSHCLWYNLRVHHFVACQKWQKMVLSLWFYHEWGRKVDHRMIAVEKQCIMPLLGDSRFRGYKNYSVTWKNNFISFGRLYLSSAKFSSA